MRSWEFCEANHFWPLRHGAVQIGTLQSRWPGSRQAQRYCQIVYVLDALTPIAALTRAEGGLAPSEKGGQ